MHFFLTSNINYAKIELAEVDLCSNENSTIYFLNGKKQKISLVYL